MGSSSDNKIYISNNSGATFTASYTTSGGVYGCASSSDGSVMLAANNAGALYASLNGGSQWNLEAGATATSWGGISISSDGTRAIALPSVSGSSFMGLNLPPTSLVISSGNISIATYRTSYQLTATSNYSGRVTFYANGKKIANCISIPTISLIATCNYSPSMLGAVTISGKIVPTNTTYAALTTELFRTLIKPRKTLR
jgi:hypothetical protein